MVSSVEADCTTVMVLAYMLIQEQKEKLVTAERDLNILQFESPLSTSERLPKLIEGSKHVYMFEMIFKQTRCFQRS